ncbi:hypothetical protein BTHI11S_03575 [Bosea thiooxidans]
MPPKLLARPFAVRIVPSPASCGFMKAGSSTAPALRADIAASSAGCLRNGLSSRWPTPTSPSGEKTMKATKSRPNQNSQFSVALER